MSAPRIERRRVPAGDTLPPDLHPVVRRVLAARGIDRPELLDTSTAGLLRPETLGGLDAATSLLALALAEARPICIIADYDADGATSCALALRALRAMGASAVDFVVPDRLRYGYGLTPPIVELARQKGAALLVTVDNGIASIDGVAAARAAGMQVLVTDHHLPGEVLPAADAIVNPNARGDGFPSKALAGVGVIFYVMLALRAHLRAQGWFDAQGISPPNLADLLDLVALGTVADVVPLDPNNRRLVAQGLARMRQGRCVAGITALCRVAGKDPARLTTGELGFALGPRLNAAGRLADMALGIELLTSDDPVRCGRIAAELDSINLTRREIEQDMSAQAHTIVAGLLATAQRDIPAGLCLFDESWHQGVVGIVASRIKERYHRPVIAFAPGDGEELKGSARSIQGVHIRDVLDAVATRNPGLLGRFGGHAMAAGLSLRREAFTRFSQAFAAEVARVADASILERVLLTDGELAAADFTLPLAAALATLLPWGQGNPAPLFDGEFNVLGRRVVGERHLKLELGAPGGVQVGAIAFGAATADWTHARRIHAAYRLEVNEWNGSESLQLQIEFARGIED